MTNQLVTALNVPVKVDHQIDYILLDGSGSMQDKWFEMLAAIDALMGPLKTAAINSRSIIHVFDSTDLHYVARDVMVSDWRPLSEDPIGAHWGGTPLFDAINLMARYFRDNMPHKGTAYIVTDGMANGGRFHGGDYTDETTARSLLDWMRANGWPVVFIGCDFNNSRQAAALGATADTAIGVQKKLLSDAMRNLAGKRTKYAAGAPDITFSDDEKQQFGGSLCDLRDPSAK
jgi:hypothetical protein